MCAEDSVNDMALEDRYAKVVCATSLGCMIQTTFLDESMKKSKYLQKMVLVMTYKFGGVLYSLIVNSD